MSTDRRFRRWSACDGRIRRGPAAGLNTAGSYKAIADSPIGGYDQQCSPPAKHTSSTMSIPAGVNEELAADAIWGSKQLNRHPVQAYGVGRQSGMASGPGVDRCGDVFGTVMRRIGRNGGALCMAGRRPRRKSSTVRQSDQASSHARDADYRSLQAHENDPRMGARHRDVAPIGLGSLKVITRRWRPPTRLISTDEMKPHQPGFSRCRPRHQSALDRRSVRPEPALAGDRASRHSPCPEPTRSNASRWISPERALRHHGVRQEL